MNTIANHRVERNTVKHKSARPLGIINGQLRRVMTWDDLAEMAINGMALIRDGEDIRIVWSEAYGQERVS